MKRFIKGNLETYVEDDDRRIPEYIKNGWKEAAMPKRQLDEADARMKKALEDVTKSSGAEDKKKAPDKKVNDALKSSKAAEKESEEIDDGLFNKDGDQ